MQAFPALMKAQTGIPCDLEPPSDSELLAEKLSKNQLHLAVFQGIEFAWVMKRNPQLRPLVIAVNGKPNRQAHLMVRQGFTGAGFADVKGKQLAMPLGGREHCWVFLQRHCRECGQEPEDFFSRIDRPNAVIALDDLVDDVVQAVVVDGVALECYKHRKPGRFAKLKELEKSEWFPDSVIAYHSGVFDEAELRRFREGLLQADKTALGRQLLTLWSLTGFENVPGDFDKTLKDIAKSYPPSSTRTATKKTEGAKSIQDRDANVKPSGRR
jgi:ABC-type phosphate/phosphonate transport system substrate-binding protein